MARFLGSSPRFGANPAKSDRFSAARLIFRWSFRFVAIDGTSTDSSTRHHGRRDFDLSLQPEHGSRIDARATNPFSDKNNEIPCTLMPISRLLP
jgi:hypothetical protein